MGMAVSIAGDGSSKFARSNSRLLRSSLKKRRFYRENRFEQRAIPDRLETLCKLTGFTPHEMKTLYRGFKEACPTGKISEDEFRQNLSHWFPGAAASYATLVFKTFDATFEKCISFKEFAVALSMLSRGTTEEKLAWIFYLYDVDRDGCISMEDVLQLVKSIYDMVASQVEPAVTPSEVREHAAEVFKKFDKKQRGVVSSEEFTKACMEDPMILRSLQTFNTIFDRDQLLHRDDLMNANDDCEKLPMD